MALARRPSAIRSKSFGLPGSVMPVAPGQIAVPQKGAANGAVAGVDLADVLLGGRLSVANGYRRASGRKRTPLRA